MRSVQVGQWPANTKLCGPETGLLRAEPSDCKTVQLPLKIRLRTKNLFPYSCLIGVKMNINFAKALIISTMIFIGSANADADVRLSTAGLGPATFGMTLQQVEIALGKPLPLNAKQRKNWSTSQCYLETKELPGVSFMFERGRLLVISLDGSSRLTTRSGIAVGDSERKAIDLLKTDPTYRRNENRYDDGSKTNMEITVGKAVFDTKANSFRGMQMKISSVSGKIVAIEAGQASYVAMDEHEDSGECM